MILFFLLGLAIGSFLNVLVRRGYRDQTLKGRSRCETCQHTLRWPELIPILSYLVQKRRCLHCRTVFSYQYPLVELGTGLLFASAFYFFEPSVYDLESVFILFTVLLGLSAAMTILVSDLLYTIIPDGAVLIIFILGVVRIITGVYSGEGGGYGADILAAAGIASFLALLWIVSRGRWIGFGDIKLFLAAALVLGFPSSLAAFLFSFWLGGGFGVALLIFSRSNLTRAIPFGPFILAGSFLAYFYADIFWSITGLNLLPLLFK